MRNKALRILIAEPEHSRQLSIEKMLNWLGYYRIALISTADEVQVLAESMLTPFDLLIVNEGVLRELGGRPAGLIHLGSAFSKIYSYEPQVRRSVSEQMIRTSMGMPNLADLTGLMRDLQPCAQSMPEELHVLPAATCGVSAGAVVRRVQG